MGPVIGIALLIGLVWVVLSLPARRRRQGHTAMQDSVEPGDEIISAGGIHGVVRETGSEDVRVEIAPGVVVTIDRRAIAAVADLETETPPADEESAPV